ncbi:MAG: tetratricopeptide repeat protein, partial [Caldimonas sp.]
MWRAAHQRSRRRPGSDGRPALAGGYGSDHAHRAARRSWLLGIRLKLQRKAPSRQGSARNSARQRVPESVLQSRYREAIALHGKGDVNAAEALYRGILAEMPASFHALHMLGVLLAQRDDLEESARLIAQAVRIDPGVAAAHANLGNTLRVLDRADEAMASYDRALRLEPGNERALKGRGLILWQTGQREKALACYEHLLTVNPGYADGWIMKAAALNHLGRNDESIACYRKALEFERASDPAKIHYMLAALGDEPPPAASPIEYVRDLFDKYARRFDAHLVGSLHYRGPQLLIEALDEWVTDTPLDVVDLGCGTGLCGPLLKPWARSLTGMDLSPKMVEEARRKG